MQELLFTDQNKKLDAPFDDYSVTRWDRVQEGRGIVLFRRTDTNGKHYYLVADRVSVNSQWRTTNAREFGHAGNRATRYFDMRRKELARDD